jgi:hypothetical protein
MIDSHRRVLLAIGVLFVIIGGVSIAVASMPGLQEWIAERTTTQTATEYARPSTVEDVRHVSWFGGILFLVLAFVFFAVSRIRDTTGDSQDELVRRALADSTWNLDDNTTVTTYTTTGDSGDDIAKLVRDALAGTATRGGAHEGGSIDAQLAQLSRLHESGALTSEEFAAAKKRLLGL